MTAVAPLTSFQQQIWPLSRADAGSTPDHLSAIISLTGLLNQKVLTASWKEIVHRHDSLRAYFIESKDGVWAHTAKPGPVHLSVIDLSCEPEAERNEQARAIAEEHAVQPFDLERGPLFRATLLRLGPELHLFAVTMHRLIGDESSIENVQRELAVLYESFSAGAKSPLADLPLQLGDLANWEQEYLQLGEFDPQFAYWIESLRDAAPLELAADHRKPERPSFRGARELIRLNSGITRKINELAREEGINSGEILSAAFETLLFRYSDETSFVLRGAVVRREYAEFQPLIGPMTTPVPVRANLGGDPAFRELLHRIHARNLNDRKNCDAPFDQIAHAQVLFSVQDSMPAALRARNITMERELIGSGYSRLDLAFYLFAKPEGIDGFFEFATDLFEPSTIRRMAGHFETLLTAAVAAPSTRISKLQLLSIEEERQIESWSGSDAASHVSPAVPFAPMHQLFECHAASSPHATALALERSQVTYAELNARANELAHDLIAAGVRTGDFVALAMRRSAELIVGVLGVLKSGAAFVATDPEWPEARIRTVLDDAAPKAVVTEPKFAGNFAGAERKLFVVESGENHPPFSGPNPAVPVQPDDLAYVIYTSGSTGNPKGALLKHRGWANLAKFQNDFFRLGAGERVLNLSSPVFDALVFESGLALTSGATLCIPGPSAPLAGPDLEAAINRFGVTAMALAPTTLAWLHPAQVPTVKLIVSAGEALRPEIADLWRKHVKLFNGYGPTETTVCTTLQLVDREFADAVPIGQPIRNVQVHLLDAHGNQVPVGVPGEVWIGGAGVGAGYLNRPRLTASYFQDGKYRSGDRARWLPNGALEFQGRKDHQVKIRGFRIELEEVEAVLHRHPGVRECAVVVEEKLQRLTAYVVADPEVDVRELLKSQLPAYMVPTQVVRLDQLPRNSSGKIDIAALKSPEMNAASLPFSGVRQIWQDVLQVPAIGPGESFFDIGGHSLLAVELLQRIEERFGKRIALADMIANPTLEFMEAEVESIANRTVVPELWAVQPDGTQPPLYFAHGDFSFGGFYCYELAEHLGDDQPLYAFPQHGPDGRAVPTSIEEMALDHVKALRRFQPHGPYRLGGLCNGGLVAYEVARELVRAGETVESLIMIAAVPRNLRLTGLNHEGGGEYIREAYRIAMVAYHPQPYNGLVDLVWPAQERRPAEYEDDPTIGWQASAPNLRLHEVPGTHLTCMLDFMRETAAMIRECLETSNAA